MSRFNKLLANFKTGELSPKLFGRKDLEEYSGGAQLFDNFIPKIQGGMSGRIGTEFIDEVLDLGVGDRGPALLPFITSKNEAFVIVINPAGVLGAVTEYIRIFKNDGTEALISAFLDVEAPSATLNPMEFVVAQVGDAVFLTHTSGTFRPLIIVRRSPSVDEFTIVDFSLSIIIENTNFTQVNTILKTPYRDTNTSAITMSNGATTGAVSVVASAPFFNAGHLNAIIKITHGTTTGAMRIQSVATSTLVGGIVLSDFGILGVSDNWEESSWSIFRGYPRTVAAFEQRLVWGGNIAEPDTLWFSRLGNVFVLMQRRFAQDFSGDTSGIKYFIPSGIPVEQQTFNGAGIQFLEDDPFSFALASVEGNPITWMSSGRNLLVGTLGAEYVLGSEGQGLSILTVTARQQTNYGGAPKKTIRTGNELHYVTRNGHKLRTFKFNEENGSYISADISLTGEHLRRLGGDIFTEYDPNFEWMDITHQASKDRIWAINSTNRLIGLVYSRENGNISWFRTTLLNSTASPANGESIKVWGITSIPSVTGGDDDLWLVVERLAPNKRFFLERIGMDFEGEDLDDQTGIEEELPRFLDSHFIVVNTSGTRITEITSGIGHLQTLDVVFMYRGENLGTFTVDGAGRIFLTSEQADKTETPGFGVIGVPFTSQWESLDIEAGGDLGFSEGHTQRIERADVRYNRTRSSKAGSIERQDPVKFNLSSNTELFTGTREIRIPNSPDKEQRIKIICDDHQPCNILSIALRGSTDD